MGAYEILGIEKTATKDQIKRAYFKKALLYVCGLP
jgi:curved DNA-binding protein CbpA